MGALMRSLDWASTPLGPISTWPQSLRTTVSTCLNSRFPILIWWGPDMVKIYNDAYREVIGAKHPRAMGARGPDMWPEIWHIIGPMLAGVLAEGKATWSENQFLLLDRHGYLEETYFTFSYSPIRDESGGIGGIYSAVTETTGQVLSERRLRTLRDLAARTASAKGEQDACRQAAEALAGSAADLPFALLYVIDTSSQQARLCSAVGLLQGLPVSPAVVSLTSEAEVWPIRPALTEVDGLVVTDLQLRSGPLVLRAHAPVPKSAILVPIALPGEESPCAVFIAGLSPHLTLDDKYRSFIKLAVGHIAMALASARSLEDAQRRAQALAELDRAKTVFFSNVSHEFRTPLTLMLGPTQDLLAEAHGALSAPQRVQLELIHRNELRLQRLVNALLNFSRIEAGRAQACYEPVDLALLTRELAGSFRAAIERAGLLFDVDCPSLAEPVYVDRGMWEQIVLNLLSNAFKFTFQGSIEVTLRALPAAIELVVRDTGVGVAPEQVPRLFERFHRIEGTRARTHEGSGIGLALVQELVRLHGGTIQPASVLGAGTSFTVTLPKGCAHLPRERVRAARDPDAWPRPGSDVELFVQEAVRWEPQPLAEPSPVTGTRPRVLIADDNADMREYLRRILSQRFDVELVADGTAALAATQAAPPQCVVTDIMMPNLDGYGLLRELRATPATARIPVIMLSARAGEESRIEGIEAGADDYLIKPFSARELLARVQTQVELCQTRHKAEQNVAEMERAARFNEMFVSMLGHDLRNPLSAIMTAASILEVRADSERIAKPVSHIASSADRMERMISQLLDFTRIRLGRGIPLTRTRVNLAELARAIVEELEPVQKRQIQLDAVGDMVGTWDHDRLSQLLSNLVANACQHGTRGIPPRIRLDGSAADKVCVEVQNHGAIAKNLLGVLFEPLRSVGDRHEKRAGASGLGLGLYISQQIASAHGGTLRVASDEDQGTRFLIELPRHPR